MEFHLRMLSQKSKYATEDSDRIWSFHWQTSALGVNGMENVRFHELQGHELDPWLMDLARLRILIFREFPYLYDGSVDYELDYLKSYQKADDGLVVMVTATDGEVIGATTCLPMAQGGTV